MAEAHPIDLDHWPRREHFDHYLTQVECKYAITVEVDVTEMAAALRGSSWKTYVAQIWAISTIVNRHAEFRMALGNENKPATWDVVHPAFTVFNPQHETFANVWSPYDGDFATFHDQAADVLAEYRGATSFQPQADMPANAFDISSLPWTSFTGFSLHMREGWNHLLPIFTLGQYREVQGRVKLPLAVQIHHAAADGFHTARLIRELEELFSDPSWLARADPQREPRAGTRGVERSSGVASRSLAGRPPLVWRVGFCVGTSAHPRFWAVSQNESYD